jgi:hypothetical protein
MSQSVEDSTIITTYKKMFGLSNVNNTSDENKALNNAENTELKNKLDLIGGTLNGTLNGTNATFTDDLTSNTSNTPIKMIQLLRLMESLQTRISILSSSNLYITTTSQFPIKIPYSSSTIDQTNIWGSTTYFFAESFRPIGMTIGDYNTSKYEGAWSIKYNTVDKDVWTNNWTVVTRVWLTNTTDITIKIGDKWNRWDNGIDGAGNYGKREAPSVDYNNPVENIYIVISRPTSAGTVKEEAISNMSRIGLNELSSLAQYWSISNGVYIIISYNQSDKLTTIKFCTSDGTSYYIIKSNIPPNTNRKPFHIYINGGVPIWNYGIVLNKILNSNPIDDITMFKNQFGLS